MTVRRVAAAAGVSVGSAHKAMAQLTELALLDKDGVPRSSLFWSVAQERTLQWFPLSRPPAADVSETLQRLLRFRLDDLDAVGWAEAGDRAAAALGAPIVAEGRPTKGPPPHSSPRHAPLQPFGIGRQALPGPSLGRS